MMPPKGETGGGTAVTRTVQEELGTIEAGMKDLRSLFDTFNRGQLQTRLDRVFSAAQSDYPPVERSGHSVESFQSAFKEFNAAAKGLADAIAAAGTARAITADLDSTVAGIAGAGDRFRDASDHLRDLLRDFQDTFQDMYTDQVNAFEHAFRVNGLDSLKWNMNDFMRVLDLYAALTVLDRSKMLRFSLLHRAESTIFHYTGAEDALAEAQHNAKNFGIFAPTVVWYEKLYQAARKNAGLKS